MFVAVPTNDETWLICGGRKFDDVNMFDTAMGSLMRVRGCPNRIVHGGCTGADEMAADFGLQMSVEVVTVRADWGKLGKAAGPLRNQRMLDEYKPHLVIAFPGERGTADIVSRARKSKIDVAEIKPT